jgi:hypothetical protein
VASLLTIFAAALLFAADASAQSAASSGVAPNRVARNKAALKKFVDATNQLSPEVRKHLSRGMQNYLRYANAAANGTTKAASSDHKKNGGPGFTGGTIRVSDPTLDPAMQGYTQNTTSSAWCGNTVVVGYEDTGAFFRTDPDGAFGVPLSFNNVSFSGDSGRSFKELRFLTPGTFSANALLGDPVVTCSSPTNFQYASILNTTTPDGLDPIVGPSISFSTNGGKTWSAPQQIVSLDGNTELADKPWLAVDPTNPRKMYLTYTHISFLSCTNIELVRSTDSGKTWSAPITVNSDCTNPNIVMDTGSSVVVSPGAKVYVAYESFPFPPSGTSFGKNAIYFTRSIDGGASFTKPMKVSDVVPGGDGVMLTGSITANDFPQLAVDRTNKPSRGTIYLTWPDGRNHIVPDANAPSGTYAYADSFVAKSTTFGVSFKVLGAISPTPKDFRGVGRDQFLPSVAVDKDGEVAVCYYDRRNDRANLRVDRYCSVSENQGKTWEDRRVTSVNWVPAVDSDPLNPTPGNAVGEYDAVTAEFLLHSDGFFGAFEIEISGNPDIVATKF